MDDASERGDSRRRTRRLCKSHGAVERRYLRQGHAGRRGAGRMERCGRGQCVPSGIDRVRRGCRAQGIDRRNHRAQSRFARGGSEARAGPSADAARGRRSPAERHVRSEVLRLVAARERARYQRLRHRAELGARPLGSRTCREESRRSDVSFGRSRLRLRASIARSDDDAGVAAVHRGDAADSTRRSSS